MAYSKSEIEKISEKIFKKIINGKSLSSILLDDDMPSRPTFYKWIVENKDIFNNYVRATKARADYLFDEILEIADRQEKDVIMVDGEEVVNHNVIQRNRLQVDARKWAASKMNPKKYGDKAEIDVTSGGEKLNQETKVTFINARKDKD